MLRKDTDDDKFIYIFKEDYVLERNSFDGTTKIMYALVSFSTVI